MRSLPAWAPADSHTGRSQAHHVSSVCGNPPSSNDKFATRLPLSDLGREAEEMSEREGEGACMCVSAPLAVIAAIEGPITCSSKSIAAFPGLSARLPFSSPETSVSEYAMSVSTRM